LNLANIREECGDSAWGLLAPGQIPACNIAVVPREGFVNVCPTLVDIAKR
jgi:hypothetical protein